MTLSWGSYWRVSWQPDCEATTLTESARHFEVATVRDDEIARNRQAQTHALRKTPRGMTPIEWLKEVCLIVG